MTDRLSCSVRNWNHRSAMDQAESSTNYDLVILSPRLREVVACMVMSHMAKKLLANYEGSRSIDDLQKGISAWRNALSLCPPGYPDRGEFFNRIATALRSRYEELGDITDLEECISSHHNALDLRPPGHPDRSTSLSNLANSLQRRYDMSGVAEDLEVCIALNRDALYLRPQGHPDRSMSLNNLANALRSRYMMSGKTEDLEDYIALHRDALHLRPPGHPDRSMSLDNLGGALSTHYAKFGNVGELEQSIAFHREALALCPPAHPAYSSRLNNLGLALDNRYEKLGNAADLNESISLHQTALNLRPPGHANRSSSLNNLATAISSRHDLLGNDEDLRSLASLNHDSLNLCPSGHPGRPMSLNNLATALNKLYHKLGNAEDLEDCIALQREALSLCPPGHRDRSVSLSNLASALQTRYNKFGHLEDLEVCIGFHCEALGLRPLGHPDRFASLNNLGAALNTRHAKFSNPKDLEDSIAFHREAFTLCPPSHPHFLTTLNSLANILQNRYDESGNAEDLEQCIVLHRDALRLRPPGHPNRSMTLTNLASALSERYWKSKTTEDLDECISFDRETVDLHPCGHPDRSMSLHRLGDSLMTRHITMSTPEDFVPALAQIVMGAYDSTSFIHDRLTAAILWIDYARASNHGSIFEAYTALLQLINRSLIFRPNVELQQRFLASTNIPRSLASDAASAAIATGNLELAVEFLEQGRALLWSRVDSYKYPLHELRQVKGGEELADRLEVVSSKLEHLSLASSSTTSDPDSSTKAAVLDSQMKEHRVLSEEWDDLVGKVREIDGFRHFLRAAPFDDLRSAAAEGPVILVNISRHRSDAIILLNDRPPELVNLPEVLLPELRGQKCDSPKEIIKTLAYLWDTIVSLIVDRLTELEVAKGSRIWWCPTAELCALPLHAAGRGQTNILNIYTSSYTLTLSSLIRARLSISQPPIIPKLLIVGQPSTDLNRVIDEVAIIKKLKPGVNVLFGPSEANREAVLENLKDHSWVHFACHGLLGDKDQPFHASFKLHEDVDRRLLLLDLIRAKLPNAELAFLSACHSAAGGLSTPDESIHLSAALQFCGFKSVVGTLWEMDDEDGPTIAEKFYKYMFRNPDQINFRDSAYALSSAIKEMRKAKVPLDRLVLFVHIGA